MASLEQVTIVTADGFSLHLSCELARDLAQRIALAANSLPKRGLEVCGLLLGEQNANTFVVTSSVPLTSRYAEGPAFRVRETELLDELRMVQPRSQIVGIYRSRNDGSLELDRQDALLLSLIAQRPIPVLVIRQQRNTQGEGRLLIWDDTTGAGGPPSAGKIFLTEEWLGGHRPRLDPRRTPSDRNESAAAQTVSDVGQTAVSNSVPEPVSPPVVPRKRNGTRMIWMATSAAFLLLLALLGWQLMALGLIPAAGPFRSANAENYPPVVVEARQASALGGQSSNPMEREREAPTAAGPDAQALQSLKRLMRTEENSTLREIAVRELGRRGTEDLETLALLAQTAQKDPSPTVRGAALESIARGWKVTRATRSFFEARWRGDESAAVRLTAERELANAGKVGWGNAESAATSTPAAAPRPQARVFRMPQTTATAPQAVQLPPPLSMGEVHNSLGLPMVQTAMAVLPGRPPSPISNVETAPIRPSAGPVETAPVLVSQFPVIAVPPEIRRLVRNETVIAVRVTVNANGRVAKIHPAEVKGGLYQVLWNVYSNGVRGWVFQPARRNKEAVVGEATVYFRLRPS